MRRIVAAFALACALIVAVDVASSRAEEPEETAPPAEIVALAPDSVVARSDPPAAPAESNSPAATADAPGRESAPPAASATPALGASDVAPNTDPAPPPAAETVGDPSKPDANPPAPKTAAPAVVKSAPRAPRNARTALAPAKNGAPKNAAPKSNAIAAVSKPSAGPATQTNEGARARAELERTEPILRSVKAKVVRSFNKKAREEFGVATARQRDAREALGENLYARAERLTLEARSLAREIAVHLGPPEDDPDYVGMTLDRTDDALKRAREVLRDAGGGVERQRLAALERRQKDARDAQKDGKTRKAYASTREVRDGVLTLLRDCDDLPVPEATAEKALKRASRSLDQAKGELGERLNTAADRLAREARAQLAKAKAAFARKNYRDTLLHSKLVERNLELAVSAQRSATNHSG